MKRKPIFFILYCVIVIPILITALFLSKEDSEKEKSFFSLEDKMFDYEYFWDFIYNNYPFREVCERKGADLKKIKEDGYKTVKNIRVHEEYYTFYRSLCKRITAGNDTAHLYAGDYFDYSEVFRKTPEFTILNKYIPVVEKFYTYMHIIDGMSSRFHSSNKKIDKELYSYEPLYKFPPIVKKFHSNGLTTEIIEKDKIAYIKINTFLIYKFEEMKNYIKTIENFFKETQNYKHIIIDISLNGGGYTSNYKYIVSINIEKGMTIENYGLYRETEFTRPYLEYYFKKYSTRIKKINKDDIPNVENCGSIMNDKAYIETQYIGKRTLKDYKLRKDKKLWLITSRSTYSAGDSFTNLCKKTGFATVIGDNTGGAGGNALWPTFMVLPKAGLLIKFDLFYGLNNEGYCIDEKGTPPDIYTSPGKTALETCLDEIKKFDSSAVKDIKNKF